MVLSYILWICSDVQGCISCISRTWFGIKRVKGLLKSFRRMALVKCDGIDLCRRFNLLTMDVDYGVICQSWLQYVDPLGYARCLITIRGLQLLKKCTLLQAKSTSSSNVSKFIHIGPNIASLIKLMLSSTKYMIYNVLWMKTCTCQIMGNKKELTQKGHISILKIVLIWRQCTKRALVKGGEKEEETPRH